MYEATVHPFSCMDLFAGPLRPPQRVTANTHTPNSHMQGPRDRLSESQRVWLKALAAVDVRAEVLRVREPSSRQPGGGKKLRRK